MRKISSRTSVDNFFLPTCFLTFESKLQYSRNPARCQRTTVSGVTTRRDLFQSVQNRYASIQKSLSKGLSFGLACLRFSTVSCWRSARFSRSSLRRERKQRATSPKLSGAKLHMHHSHSKSCDEEIVQTVDFGPGQSFGEAQRRHCSPMWIAIASASVINVCCTFTTPARRGRDAGAACNYAGTASRSRPT